MLEYVEKNLFFITNDSTSSSGFFFTDFAAIQDNGISLILSLEKTSLSLGENSLSLGGKFLSLGGKFLSFRKST